MLQIVAEADLQLLCRSLCQLQRSCQRPVKGLPVYVRRPCGFLLDQRHLPLVFVGPGAIVTHSQSGSGFDNSYTMVFGTWAGLASLTLLPQTTTKEQAPCLLPEHLLPF
jgi:hypothetical protein